MTGSWQVRVHAVRPFTIHGDVYFEVHVSRLDQIELQAISLRLPQHAIRSAPQAGQSLELSFLMGQVTAARVID